jgi:hypothetical protein
MTRCLIARECVGEQVHPVRLEGVTGKPVRVLCAGCLWAARTLGMAPTPVPMWLARGGLARDETGLRAA